MADDAAFRQRFTGRDDGELVGAGKPGGHPPVKMFEGVVAPHLRPDPGRERGHVEQVHGTDAALPRQQRAGKFGDVTARGAEDAETGYGDACAIH
jgi:hypothetical protein